MKKTGIDLIIEERKRQIEVEGYKPEHDCQYKNAELFKAACCYQAAKRARAIWGNDYLPIDTWPWDIKWWKPTPENRIRELEKAGALFLAHNDLKRNKPIDDWVLMCAKEIDDILNKSS
jgi:hypothetical protein